MPLAEPVVSGIMARPEIRERPKFPPFAKGGSTISAVLQLATGERHCIASQLLTDTRPPLVAELMPPVLLVVVTRPRSTIGCWGRESRTEFTCRSLDGKVL